MKALTRACSVILALSACDRPRSTPAAGVSPAPLASVSDADIMRESGATAPEEGGASTTTRYVSLPGASGPAFLDYVAYEHPHLRVWVPVPGTASVDVFDIASATFSRIDGFTSAQREAHGKPRTFGPSAVSIGESVAYVGNRATSEVCPVDLKTLKVSACLKLPSALDGVAYVASAKEVWVTNPEDQTLTVLDASKPDALKSKTLVRVDGAPEGYAVDDTRGLFFTNLEDKGGTVVIDVKSHHVEGSWSAGCGKDGPRGVAVDRVYGLVVVACTNHVQVLDALHEGAKLGTLDTGAGVDNIDIVEAQHMLYVAAAKAERLTIARIDRKGQLTVGATVPTSPGARNAVADGKGNAYVGDSQGARLIIVQAH